ncbi:MAG: sulfatase-like hydrolase/transferase [Pirellulales bacterium]|nr:sulfatase-like hydrolase/transferase [Pirellulales bacterium]
MRNLVCLVIDGLGAGALGCYGNTWLETPALDRLAAESLVFDQATVECPDLTSVYRAWWQGIPSDADDAQQLTLVRVLADAGFATCLMTDDQSLATHALAADFDQQVVLPNVDCNSATETIDQTHAAQFFAAALDALGKLKTPHFAWLHWQGMLGTWDAPRRFRERLADDEDPSPPDFVDVPSLQLPEDDDPDHLLGMMQAYGGQVALLDECFGAFAEQVFSDSRLEDTLFMLLSPRGFPLGEHRGVGLAMDDAGCIAGPPYSELVHVPWLMRFGDGRRRLDRSAALVQPIDLPATALAALSVETAAFDGCGRNLLAENLHQDDAVRECAFMSTSTHVGVRTRQWHYVQPKDSSVDSEVGDETLAAELYVKSDDRWEVNNVANLCRDEAEDCKLALERR